MNKPIYLPLMKYGLLLMSVALAIAGVACMIDGETLKLMLFFCMMQFNFIGAAIVFYLDAIYETRNPNQS